MTVRELLHQLVDELPERELDEARELLQGLSRRHAAAGYLPTRDAGGLPPILADAPIDDEPLTEADEAALAEAYKDLREGNVVSMAEIHREFGG
jgi:hypothetical protein